jgi:hypothetical protein
MYKNDMKNMKQYLLKNISLEKTKKPILWIHIPHEYNSRNWIDFGSRSSFELNQPYLHLTVKSIIKHCDESFKIVLIDDNSFSDIIPDWNINIDILSDPTKQIVRQLAICKIIYIYGGMNVPISFLCMRNLISLYEKGIKHNKLFVCENVNRTITSTNYQFYADCEFIGSEKENEYMKEFIHFIEKTLSHDFTNQSIFLGDFNRWCNSKTNKVTIISGLDVGTKTVDEEPILVDTLLAQDYIH